MPRVFCKACNSAEELHVDDARCPSGETVFEPCETCRQGTPVPHTASPRCKSGKQPHCSCDTCF